MGRLLDEDDVIDAINKRISVLQKHPEFRRKNAVIDLYGIKPMIAELPSAQPELIEQGAYVRGFEQGRTQGRIDAQGELMSRLIDNTIKAEWTNADALDLPSAEPERKVGKWTEDNACEFCGFQPWYEHDIHILSFCPNYGADMRGEEKE